MKRWLVTGAAGFLGSHVVEKLLAEKAEVHALDNLSWGHRSFVEANRSKMSFHEIDIRNKEALDESIKKIQPTHVIHLAALHFIPAAIKNPSVAIDINVLGTQNLLQSLREHSKFEAFWFASTGDVYAPDEKPHHVQNSAIAPFNIYGLSKLMGEKIVELESKQAPQARYIVGRLFNLYGSRETNPHILPEILGQVKKQTGEVTLSLGSIWPKRDMVPVDQAAVSIIKSMNRVSATDAPVSTHNFATGKAVSMEQMIREIEKLIQRKINIVLDPSKVRAVERSHLEADVNSLREFIGSSPSPDLTRGLKELLEGEGLLPSTALGRSPEI